MKRLICAGLLLMAQGAFAQGKPPEAPKPSDEMVAQTKFWTGKWACKGKAGGGAFGPEHPTATTLEFKPILGGFWLHMNWEQKKTKDMPGEMGEMMAGWDPVKKVLARVDYLSNGGWAMFTSTGWQGDAITFSGDGQMMGKMMKMTHSMTRKGDSEMSGKMEVAGPDGKMATLFEETCTKAKK
jgi:Protein of unknown function (DUF1579)